MSAKSQRKLSPQWQLAIRLIVSAALMVYLIQMINWKEAFIIIKEGSFLYIFAAFLAIQITVSSSVIKWYMLVHPSHQKTDKEKISIHRLGRLYYVGLFFNNFLPGSVGGDIVRIVQLGKDIGMSRSTASVALERLTSGAALVGIVLIMSLFIDDARPYLISLVVIIVAAIIIYLVYKIWIKKKKDDSVSVPKTKLGNLMNKGKKAVIHFSETVYNYRHEGWKWWTVVAVLSLLFQFGMAWINDLLFKSFGFDIPWIELLVIITLISFITMIPVSLNGLGVREASYVYFFQHLGVPDGVSLSVSLLFLFLVSISSLVGGLFWLTERRKNE